VITTTKPYPHFTTDCDCGAEIHIASGLSSGQLAPAICEDCWQVLYLRIPEGARGRDYNKQTRVIREGIINIFNDIRMPMTVRQVYYRAIAAALVPKSESKGYGPVQSQLLQMRREGSLPYSFIADNTRFRIKPDSHNTLKDALETELRRFRIDMWKNLDEHVEIWLEKDALASIFSDITSEYDVPLFVSRGFSSESFLYQSAENIRRIGKPTTIYLFSDWDPSGVELTNSIEKLLPRFNIGVDINFVRKALTPSHIRDFNLATRPTKRTKKKPTMQRMAVTFPLQPITRRV
jgi:5S rRNA maturation endonuclease (ribonuclease M5)